MSYPNEDNSALRNQPMNHAVECAVRDFYLRLLDVRQYTHSKADVPGMQMYFSRKAYFELAMNLRRLFLPSVAPVSSVVLSQ